MRTKISKSYTDEEDSRISEICTIERNFVKWFLYILFRLFLSFANLVRPLYTPLYPTPSSTFCFLLFLITFNNPRLFLGILLFLEKLIPSFIQHLEQVAQSPRRELFDSYLFQIYL